MLRHNRKIGQAIVEFALAATLIFFLLAAAVDLGLMFFTVQGLHNAAQEGATFGSRWLLSSPSAGRILDYNGIRDRVRHESGARGGIGFVNLLDLNNDGIVDINPDAPPTGTTCTGCAATGVACTGCQKNPATGNTTNVVEDHIQVWSLEDTNLNGDPLDDGAAPNFTPCRNPSGATPCFIRVVVSTNYKLLFPLSPTFTRERTLRSSFVMQLRDSFRQGGQPTMQPIFQTATPTPNNLTVSLVNYYKPNGNGRPVSLKVLVRFNGMAYDGATVSGTIGGVNVTLVGSGGGTGYYTVCNWMGSGSGFGSNAGASITATNGSASASGGPWNPDNRSFTCP